MELDCYRAGECKNIHVHTLGNVINLLARGHEFIFIEPYEVIGDDPVVAFEMTSDRDGQVLEGRDQVEKAVTDFAALIRARLFEVFPRAKQFYLRNVHARGGMQLVELAVLDEEIKSDAVDFFEEYLDE